MVALPVIVVDYAPILYTPDDELAQAIQDIHMWATWFPDHFIILSQQQWGVD